MPKHLTLILSLCGSFMWATADAQTPGHWHLKVDSVELRHPSYGYGVDFVPDPNNLGPLFWLEGETGFMTMSILHDHSADVRGNSFVKHYWFGTYSNTLFEQTAGNVPFKENYYYDGQWLYALCMIVEYTKNDADQENGQLLDWLETATQETRTLDATDVWVDTGALSNYDANAYLWNYTLGEFATVPLITATNQ